MLIDLHTHTRPYSWDSYLAPDDLIERSRAAGLDGICLSEHDYLWDPDDVAALAKRHNYVVLPAIEINTDDGHILVYGNDHAEMTVNLVKLDEARTRVHVTLVKQ